MFFDANTVISVKAIFVCVHCRDMYVNSHVRVNLSRCEMKHVSVDLCQHCDFCEGNICLRSLQGHVR